MTCIYRRDLRPLFSTRQSFLFNPGANIRKFRLAIDYANFSINCSVMLPNQRNTIFTVA